MSVFVKSVYLPATPSLSAPLLIFSFSSKKQQAKALVEVSCPVFTLTTAKFHTTNISFFVNGSNYWSTLSSSGIPSSRKMKSYWRESSGGLEGW